LDKTGEFLLLDILTLLEMANSKSEIRNSKQTRNSNKKMTQTDTGLINQAKVWPCSTYFLLDAGLGLWRTAEMDARRIPV
jgi:hypothetical protein